MEDNNIAWMEEWLQFNRGTLNLEIELYGSRTLLTSLTWQPAYRKALPLRVLGKPNNLQDLLRSLDKLRKLTVAFETTLGSRVTLDLKGKSPVKGRYNSVDVPTLPDPDNPDVQFEPVIKEDGLGSGAIISFVYRNVRRGSVVHRPPLPLDTTQTGSVKELSEYPDGDYSSWPSIAELAEQGCSLVEWDNLGFLSGAAGIAIVRNGEMIETKCLFIA